MSTKQCKQCEQLLPVEDYYFKDKLTRRRTNICKKCHCKNAAVYQQERSV